MNENQQYILAQLIEKWKKDPSRSFHSHVAEWQDWYQEWGYAHDVAEIDDDSFARLLKDIDDGKWKSRF